MKNKLFQNSQISQKIKNFTKVLFQDKLVKTLQEHLELEAETPDDIKVKNEIAKMYYKINKIDEAVDMYAKIIEYNEKKDFTLKAIKACNSILKIKPDLIPYNIKLAGLYLKLQMINEAANQYRIAINHYASMGDSQKTISLSQDLVKIDPSDDNREKLAEIYQNAGMKDEAVHQYETLAKNSRTNKNLDKLLYYYELILPHRPNNKAILKDVCILHLRNQRPERVVKIMDHYNIKDDPQFAELKNKTKLMIDALKKNKAVTK